MGTSNWQSISYCSELIYKVHPQRVLDIGVGSVGRYGMLVREFVDIWDGHTLPEDWTVTVDGIEAFEPIIREFHYGYYNHIYFGDAFDVIDDLDYYDLIILGDVIEHFEHERAISMLKKCLLHANFVMVVTPLGTLDMWPQDDAYGNEWERHRTVFKLKDFRRSRKLWKVVEEKTFRDFINRKFGAFLLSRPDIKPKFKKR